MHKILIADDDPKIIKILEHTMKKEGYRVFTATDGEDAVNKTKVIKPDLIILDVMMPKIDGYEVCKKIKTIYDVPIIMLSAKSDEIDKILGFKLGIDDYQAKPFSPSELAHRVKAVLRRSIAGSTVKAEQISYPELEINRNTRKVLANGREVELTAKEFDLLWLLASNPGQVFSREYLFEKIWDSSCIGDENTVTVHIRRIREKIERNPAQPDMIKTVWGVGYKFEN